MKTLILSILITFSAGCAGQNAKQPGTGDCVLQSGPVECVDGMQINSPRGAQPWQPCSYYTTGCPHGSACRLGDDVGVCY